MGDYKHLEQRGATTATCWMEMVAAAVAWWRTILFAMRALERRPMCARNVWMWSVGTTVKVIRVTIIERFLLATGLRDRQILQC
jgi:hypothetical protein